MLKMIRPIPSIQKRVCRVCGSPIIKPEVKKNGLCLKCSLGVIKTSGRHW